MVSFLTAGKFAAHALDRLAWIPRIMYTRATRQDFQNVSYSLKRPVWCFSLLFIASVLSVTNKTDNSCVVCNKCFKGK